MEPLLTRLDPEDTAAFHAVVRQYLELGIVTEETLAHALNTSRTSIQRWQHGRSAPHPAMRTGVYGFLRRNLYNACWSILVQHVGAREEGREDFVRVAIDPDPKHTLTEYRFMGILGFGGKFWRYDGRLYCTYYPEDETPERREALDRVNSLLADITPKYL